MREVFKPWRRKIGVLTLLMACVFAVAWLRSFRMNETITIRSGTFTHESLVSVERRVGWLRSRDQIESADRELGLTFPHWWYAALPGIRPDPARPFFGSADVHWRWQFLGAGSGEIPAFSSDFDDSSARHIDFVVIPDWAVVVPLTLLSAYLLLTKPRPAKPSSPDPDHA